MIYKLGRNNDKKIRIVFYCLREMHLPILLPIYKELIKIVRLNKWNNYEISFMAPEYKNSNDGIIQEGLGNESLKLLIKENINFIGSITEKKFDCVIFSDVCFDRVDGLGPVLSVGHGTISKGIYFTNTPIARRENFAKTLCVPGPWFKQSYGKNVFIDIVDTGFSKMDELYYYDTMKNKDFLESINFSLTKKTILFAPTFNYELTSMYELAEEWQKLDSTKYQILFKLHGVANEEIKDYYIKLSSFFENLYYIEDSSISFFMNVSDILISDVSSVFIEYLILNKPIILYNNPQIKELPSYDKNNIEYQARDASYQFNRKEELIQILNSIEDNDLLFTKRLEYAKELFPKFDGKNCSRIVDEIIRMTDENTNKIELPPGEKSLSIYLPNEIVDPNIVKLNIENTKFPHKIFLEKDNMYLSFFLNNFENVKIIDDNILPSLPCVLITGEYLFPKEWDHFWYVFSYFKEDEGIFAPLLDESGGNQKHSIIKGKPLILNNQDLLPVYQSLSKFQIDFYYYKSIQCLKPDGLIFSAKFDIEIFRNWYNKNLANYENQKRLAYETRKKKLSVNVITNFYAYKKS